MMRISIFGPLNVVEGERFFGASDLGGKKPKELLEILLLARGRPVSKDVLADRLWPDQQPKNVAGTLETYVSVLRSTLFRDRSRAREVLVTGSGSYTFCLDQGSLDLDEFDRLVARADQHGTDRLNLLRQATEVAVGDILEDAPAAFWAEADREVYRDRVTRVNLLVADSLVHVGDYPTAIKHADRALRFRPYSEQATRLLMLANHGLGQAELARQAFDRCRTLIGNELDLDCSTETVDLAGAISAGATIEELLSARECTGGSALQPSLHPNDRRDPDRRMPFIGRQAEIGRVKEVARESRLGHFKVVVVHGRPCVGRTSFLEALQSELPGSVGRFAYSHLHRETPRLPLAEVLCDALSGRPELVTAETYASAAMLGGQDPAFVMLGELLQIDVPLVLLLDDFQRADVDTVWMINRLRRAFPRLDVTVVAAMRDDFGEDTDFEGDTGFRSDLVADETIRLSSFRVDEWEGLEEIDTSLANCTGGSPALMADCFRWHQAGNSGPSPSVRESILRMARGLGGAGSQLLQDAAVGSSEFEESSLLGSDSPCPLYNERDLAKLCDMEILERVQEGYRFKSPVVRRVIAGTVRD